MNYYQTKSGLKVAFVTGEASILDATRGIGVHTGELVKSINQLFSRSVKITENIQSADIVHYTKFRPFFVDIPFFKPKNQKWVLTIHDLIPLIYPNHYPSGIKGGLNLLINKFLVRKNIDAIITISETSKKDICRFLGVTPDKVHVIHLAPATRNQISESTPLPEKFVLYVGDVNYNKNISILIKATQKLNLKLVIVGKQAKEIEKMNLNHAELEHLKNIDWSNTLRLGFVDDGNIVSIYKKAFCYVQPSFYEGFGLPILEAMAAGCPVIAAKTQALVEVGGEACIYFDPYDFSDLSKKIRFIIEDSRFRNQQIQKGFERVKNFSWEMSARQTVNIYEKVLL